MLLLECTLAVSVYIQSDWHDLPKDLHKYVQSVAIINYAIIIVRNMYEETERNQQSHQKSTGFWYAFILYN